MSLFLIAIIYQLLQLIALPFLFIYLIYKEIRYSPVVGDLTQRLGFVPTVSSQTQQIIWLHAVSVGEALSIETLIKKIKKAHPNAMIYATTGTTAGKKIATKHLAPDYLSLMPYDFLIPMMLAFKRIRPTSIILVEAEIWPNFLFLAKLHKAPVYLLNARMNRSFKLYNLLSFFFSPILNIFHHFFAQSEQDKEKFCKLGITTNKISVLGNIKSFNVHYKLQEYLQHHPDAKLIPQKQINNCTTLLVGSIHPGELIYYLELFKELKPTYQELKLILAPRHFHWQESLEADCRKTGYSVIKLTQKSAQRVPEILKNNKADIILICELSELFKLHAYADIFYLGGTFVPVGGHNLLEPAAWANPMIIGPWHTNCHPISEELEAINALIKVTDQKLLQETTEKLIQNENLRKQMGTAASGWLLKQSQSIDTIIAKLIAQLN